MNESTTASAPWALLVECARPNPGIERLDEMLRRLVDWPVFLELAEKHCVFGLAASRFLDCGQGAVPPEILQELRERYRAQALFTLLLTAEMFRLFDRFTASGVEALVTKGPALGYEPRVPMTAIQAKKIPGEYAFRQSSTKLLVEFHTELTFRYHPQPLPVEKLFKRQVRVEIDAHDVPALSAEDELILISIHGAKHFWEQLSYIADVAAFVSRQDLDWALVRSSAEEVGGERMLNVGLRLAADVLGAPLPENVAAQVRSDRAAGSLVGQIMRWLPAAGSAPSGILARAMFRMRMRGGVFSAPAYLFRLSFSPTEEDWIEGARNKRHWFLDALGRPFRLARKYGKDGKP
jgi:hypothetical protein